MSRKRPFGVTLLAVLAALGAVLAIYHTLQMLGLLPIQGPFGIFKFFTLSWLGAIVWGLLAFIYIWVVRMLWTLDVRGWLFVTALSALNLIFAVISILGSSSWQAMLPAILVNGLILIYCQLPGTKEAFQVEQMQQAAHASPSASEPEEIQREIVVDEEPPTDEYDDYVEGVEMETAVSDEAAPPDSEMEVTIADESDPVENIAPATTAEIIDEHAHSSRGEVAKFSAEAEFIKGIGPVYAEKLKAVGIETPQDMLAVGATLKGREELAEKTEISFKLIAKWTREADLYRIKGVGQQYANLLDVAGVNTVLELAQRNPDNLHQKLIEVNQEKHLVHEVPSLNNVKDWVAQAKELPRVISY